MRGAVAQLTDTFGGLDIVVANAGINGVWAPIDDLKPDEWDKTIAVNLRGTYLTLHLTVPHLKRHGGSIIVVSSINGTRTFTTPGATAYTATKAGQVAMVQQLALELGRHGIRVNAVCPGEIETNISANTDSRHREETEVPVIWPQGDIPIAGGKAGKSEDVAETILSSPPSAPDTSPVRQSGSTAVRACCDSPCSQELSRSAGRCREYKVPARAGRRATHSVRRRRVRYAAAPVSPRRNRRRSTG